MQMRILKGALLVLVTNFSGLILRAQTEEPILATITYKFIHVTDTNNRDNPVKTDMVLHIGRINSKYNTMVRENVIRAIRKANREPVIVAGPPVVVTGYPSARVKSQTIDIDDLYQVPGKKLIVTTSSFGMQHYLTETQMPEIKWKIEDEVRTIGNYTCQKAIGAFGGRIYTAWFTTELPFQYGPWKLSGLPGVILEASDENEEVFFLFKDISKTPEEEMIVTGNRKWVKISEAALTRAKKMYAQDPSGIMQAKLTPGSPAPVIAYQDSSGRTLYGDEAKAMIKKESKNTINNPLELKKH